MYAAYANRLDFTVKFHFQVLAEENPGKNIVVSPLGMKIVLIQMMAAAGGETRAEILRALQLPPNEVEPTTLLQTLQSLVTCTPPVRACVTSRHDY